MGDWTEANMAGGHVQHKLSAVRVKALKAPGKYEDGGGLRLVVGPNGGKHWVVRVTVSGRRLERGFGTYPDISLEAARDAASISDEGVAYIISCGRPSSSHLGACPQDSSKALLNAPEAR